MAVVCAATRCSEKIDRNTVVGSECKTFASTHIPSPTRTFLLEEVRYRPSSKKNLCIAYVTAKMTTRRKRRISERMVERLSVISAKERL